MSTRRPEFLQLNLYEDTSSLQHANTAIGLTVAERTFDLTDDDTVLEQKSPQGGVLGAKIERHCHLCGHIT